MSDRMPNCVPHQRDWLGLILGALGLVGLYVLSGHHFLLFHCLTEAFSIVIAIAVFAIFWNTRHFLDGSAYWVIGLGCLFGGILDLIYVLAYPGMAIFAGADGNLALQAKTVAQWYVSLSCVCAIPLLHRKINERLVLGVYAGLLMLALGTIVGGIFPDCFREGGGITLFERLGLVVSCSAYLLALVCLFRRRDDFDAHVFWLLIGVLGAFCVEDLASALAINMNGPARTIAHLCQVVALYLIYKAFVEVGLTRPYDLLFRNQRQTAEALEHQRKFLEAVLDHVHSGIVACDGQGVLTLFNRASRRLHGLSEERLWPAQWAEHYSLYQADGQTRMTTEEVPLFRALHGEHIEQVEMAIRSRDGTLRTCLASGEPLLDKDGLRFGAVVGLHDITERKQAEQALRESEERYRALFSSMTDGFALHEIVTDEQGRPCDYRYLDVNPSFERLTGYRRQDILGKLKRQATPGEDEFWIQTYGAVALGGPPARFEHCTPGSERYWHVYAYSPAPRQFAVFFNDVSERKRAEQALRKSEERLSLVITAAGIGTWDWDIASDLLIWSPSCLALFGLSPETPMSYPRFLAAVHPDDRADIDQAIRAAIDDHQDYKVEKRTIWPDGSLHWVAGRGRAYYNAAGQAVRMSGASWDITERKQAEEAMRLEDLRLQALVQLHQMAGASEQEIMAFAQEAAVAMTASELGYLAFLNEDESVLTMQSWSKTAMRECAVADQPIVYPVVATGLWGEAVRQRAPVITNDYTAPTPLKKGYPAGHVHLHRHMNVPVFEGDRVVLVVGVGNKPQPYDESDVRQLTLLMQGMWQLLQRKRTAEAIQQSEERNRLLVETLPQAAWRQSADGQEMDCNRRWYEYTGQTPAEVRGDGWLAAVHPDDVLWVAESAARAAAAGEAYEVEYRLRRAADNSYRWHLARVVPVRGADQQVLCWIGSATDIEELKQAQETLKRAHAEQLQRHSAELAHAARLSTMGEMAASLAHELNQPLHAVKNYARGGVRRLQKLPQRDEELVAALEQIGAEANRAAEIVRRVRAFVEKREPQVSAVAINALVEEVVLLGKAELEQRHLRIVLDLAADLPPVNGDPIQIEQVLMNLVRNGAEALDDTAEPDRLLSVKTMRSGSDQIQVAVCDNGRGLGGHDPERIFEPFFTTKPEGMGMGLAISRSIVQAHGGRLWVDTGQVQGCTFCFTLPIGKENP